MFPFLFHRLGKWVLKRWHRAREVKWVKCLLHRYGKLSLNAQDLYKTGSWTYACNPMCLRWYGRQRQENRQKLLYQISVATAKEMFSQARSRRQALISQVCPQTCVYALCAHTLRSFCSLFFWRVWFPTVLIVLQELIFSSDSYPPSYLYHVYPVSASVFMTLMLKMDLMLPQKLNSQELWVIFSF